MNLVSRYAVAVVSVLMTMLMFGVKTHAQMIGAGIYSGASMCNYQYQVGDAATEIADRIDEEKGILKEMKTDLSEKTKELDAAKRNLTKAMQSFSSTGYPSNTAAYKFIEAQISNPRDCSAFQLSDSDKAERCLVIGETNCATKIKPEPTEPFSQSVWRNYCNQSDRSVKGEICREKVSGQTAYKYDANECSNALNEWQKLKKQVAQLTDEVKQRKAAVVAQSKYISSDLNKQYKSAVKEYQREQREEATEGGCIDCMIAGSGGVYRPPKVSPWEIAGNVALGLGAMYLGKEMTGYVSDNNAKLGFATQAPPSFGYGFPYFMGAMYGAIGGGIGGGAFGCGGGMGGTGNGMGPYGMMGPFGLGGMYGPNGGAFGYPAGMYPGQLGGGMFLPGMGPWGMAGPWGLGGGGMPGMGPWGMPGGGMMGMMASAGMMGMPGGMMGMMGPGGGMMGMMGGMMASAGMMGMPGGMMGMMGPGGGMMGMMGGMMASAGMMGMPGGMMGMMGPGGGMMGGMMASAGMMGMPGGGMMGMMGPGGGMMGMMGPGGGMMGMMGGDGGQMQMQMQMQMMQMQMQQSQMMMQMQMKRYENYMAQQRVVGGLYQELYTLMYRIQAAQQGALSGGMGMDFGFGGSFGNTPGMPSAATPPFFPGATNPGTGTSVPNVR